MSEITFNEPEFNPATNVKFRGKFISDLSTQELVEALYQALREIHRLQQNKRP